MEVKGLALSRTDGECVILRDADGRHLATVQIIATRRGRCQVKLWALPEIRFVRAELESDGGSR